MEAEHEGQEGGSTEGPLVVGADNDAPDVARPRRDQPMPPSWAHDVDPHFVPDDYAARIVPARSVSTVTLVVVILLTLFLVGMVVDFVMAVRQSGAGAHLALGFIYGAAIQFAGWWTVIHLIRHR